MSYYGGLVTNVGNSLLASMASGDTLEITRIMFGSGTVDSKETAMTLTDLIMPVVEGVGTTPVAEDNVVTLTAEYRNDLNDGLEEDFYIGEFGIFAKTEDVGETLLFYASLGDYLQYVHAYTPYRIESRRYPLSIVFGIDTDINIEVTYNAGAFITAADAQAMMEVYVTDLQAQIDAAQAAADAAQATADEALALITYTRNSASVPYQTGSLVYTGSEQSPEWADYDSDALEIGGTYAATDAGTYTATFTPTGDSHWSDGTTTTIEVTWSIGKASIYTIPSTDSVLTYDGTEQSPEWNNYDEDQLTIGGTYAATDAGSYTATFTPTGNWRWSDETTTAKSVGWSIGKAAITTTPSQSGTLTYTGSAQSPSWNNYDEDELTIGGTTSATDAGTYTATFTPTANYMWSGGSTSAKSVTWTIGNKSATVPSQSGTLTYSGSAQSPSWSNYDSSIMTIGGTTSATNAGSYTATFTLADSYQWSDGTTAAKSVTWKIGRQSISTTPSQSGSLTYSGSAQSPSWSNYSTTQLTIGGTTSATNAGSYTATFTPTSNYQWSDGTTTAKSVTWTIGKKSVTKPTLSSSSSVDYNGSAQSPTISNYNSSYMTQKLNGTTASTISATNAGTYTITYTLTSTTNYQWADGTTAAVSLTWTINKIDPGLEIASYTNTYTKNLLVSNNWYFNPFKLSWSGGATATITVSNLYDSYTAEALYSESTGSSAPSSPFSYVYKYGTAYYPYSLRTVEDSYEETYVVTDEDEDGNVNEHEETRTVYVYAYERIDTLTCTPSDISSGYIRLKVFDSTTVSNNWLQITVTLPVSTNYTASEKTYLFKASDSTTLVIYEVAEDGTQTTLTTIADD